VEEELVEEGSERGGTESAEEDEEDEFGADDEVHGLFGDDDEDIMRAARSQARCRALH